MRDLPELADSITDALEPNFRSRLLAQGQAQSLIRRRGILPADAPRFAATLDDDLLGYGYALISNSLRILDLDEDPDDEQPEEYLPVARKGLIHASYAIEAATRNAAAAPDLAFHRLIAGAASHLGGFAARAFSLVRAAIASGYLAPMERCLADIILRSLDDIETRARDLRTSAAQSDDALLQALLDHVAQSDTDGPGGPSGEPANAHSGPVELLLTENYVSAVATALFALARGSQQLLDEALGQLWDGQEAAQDVSAPGPWWVHRLTRILVADLASTSIRANIPPSMPLWADEAPGSTEEKRRRHNRWNRLRGTFIDSLFERSRSEIDLWPSQLNVVDRIFRDRSDLVVSLPTSAGKTRIAELCILACLAEGKRIVYVTPLRALSAQTERVLDRTFAPLGVSVSSLYRAAGVSDWDDSAIRISQIVVATPEKLDFALRADSAVLDDVGLIVLDEGHMIGPNEREVRYEAQIQRLVKRSDADARRIVCLSAVFPSGEELTDFVNWLTDDNASGLHREFWRPREQRFGLIEWRDTHARMTMALGDEQSFIPRYIEAVAASSGRRKKAFPANQRELVIASAWKLVDEGQTVLVFCPQRNSVEPYAREILRLHRQGLIQPILPPGVDLSDALTIGAEWFGSNHEILRCLELGVAIHHGALPGPFRREIERLLSEGQIKVTIASPTLAQGLNLSASVVLFHALRRGGNVLTGAEFANVIGRAGRAFIDTEGIVLYPCFEPAEWRRREWLALTTGDGGKTLRSGLVEVGRRLIVRIVASAGIQDTQALLDYLTSGPGWAFPVVADENDEQAADAAASWRTNLALLDTGLLSVLGEAEPDADQVTQTLVDLLQGSLWQRQVDRLDSATSTALRDVVNSRAQFIWSTSSPAQRRGWFLAGLAADSGTELGLASASIVERTAQAEHLLLLGQYEEAVVAIQALARDVFSLAPFGAESHLDQETRQSVLRQWLQGGPLSELSADDRQAIEISQFVEGDLIYRLVWGLEAARVYETAQGNLVADTLAGSVLRAIETGTLSGSASVLIRAGFDHRLAAIKAVAETGAVFDDVFEMRDWIEDLDPHLSYDEQWPTAESRSSWEAFAWRGTRTRTRRWRKIVRTIDEVTWISEIPDPQTWLRVLPDGPETVGLWTPGFEKLGRADIAIAPEVGGVVYARRSTSGRGIDLHYRGPGQVS